MLGRLQIYKQNFKTKITRNRANRAPTRPCFHVINNNAFLTVATGNGNPVCALTMNTLQPSAQQNLLNLLMSTTLQAHTTQRLQ